ncbi:ATP synthase subunit I [Halobacillus litoralis]|uniref:ATP synthase subunit I n=1 Tax=Halobacillus litoralis TaxID=45668 RepID=A0A845E5P1_9BACI|nr:MULTISPECIES: ATP synthase subunit I [Halobacillus]MBN9655265.1 ATP synthase subunit I [Halobacillus sp. GSS1]MEC3884194.1 ATP synthase subunit I [Halobacillus sp. HZG1]MYL49499.1 ATP synthase subunit I [Halobacillus litoralis]MYL69697.1 ATP synthase subunit I [Halobacillus litoralis]
MQGYQQMMTRQRKWMFYLLALFVLGWGITPWQPIFLGLLLGSALSFYNLWLMQRKIRKLGEASADNRSVRGIGTFTRLASGALAVVIALQFEEYFHLIAVVLGLMAAYIVILIDYLFNKSTV